MAWDLQTKKDHYKGAAAAKGSGSLATSGGVTMKGGKSMNFLSLMLATGLLLLPALVLRPKKKRLKQVSKCLWPNMHQFSQKHRLQLPCRPG